MNRIETAYRTEWEVMSIIADEAKEEKDFLWLKSNDPDLDGYNRVYRLNTRTSGDSCSCSEIFYNSKSLTQTCQDKNGKDYFWIVDNSLDSVEGDFFDMDIKSFAKHVQHGFNLPDSFLNPFEKRLRLTAHALESRFIGLRGQDGEIAAALCWFVAPGTQKALLLNGFTYEKYRRNGYGRMLFKHAQAVSKHPFVTRTQNPIVSKGIRQAGGHFAGVHLVEKITKQG